MKKTVMTSVAACMALMFLVASPTMVLAANGADIQVQSEDGSKGDKKGGCGGKKGGCGGDS